MTAFHHAAVVIIIVIPLEPNFNSIAITTAAFLSLIFGCCCCCGWSWHLRLVGSLSAHP